MAQVFLGGKYNSLSCITETKQLRLHTFIREEGFCLQLFLVCVLVIHSPKPDGLTDFPLVKN